MLFDRIALFVAVASHGSLSKAAEGMHVTPSAVSQRLRILESEIGVKLYKRRTGIELTPAGRMVLMTGSKVLQQIEVLRKALRPDAEAPVTKLTVAATHTPAAKCVPSVIAVFQKSRPDVEVTFITSNRSAVEKSLRDGEVDVAVIQTPSHECKTDLHVEEFAHNVLWLFTYPSHSLACARSLTIDCLNKASLIVREGKGITETLLALVRARGIQPNVALRCAIPDAVKAAVRNKMGVGVLFRDMIDEEVRRREFKLLRIAGLPNLTGDSYIVFQKGKPLSPAAADFITLLRDLRSKQKHSLRSITQP